MDPLSVAASVAGLVSLAGELVPALYNLGFAVKEANKDAQAAATEVANMSVVLQGLQSYIVGRTRANPQRLRLITVEHITASLTACVFTYSELDAVLKALHVDSGLKAWDRAVWFVKRESVQNLVSRLQNHKMSFSCMLNILQCNSAGEAERSMDRLCDQVDLLLKENKELSGRLRNLEHLSGGGSSQRSIASITRGSLRQGNSHTSAQSITSRSSHVQSIDSNGPPFVSASVLVASAGTNNEPPRVLAFEEQLHRSRVYRHAHANHSESSLVDDGRSTLALSICSSLTLGEVSNISVFALPVFAIELSNALAYNFARSLEVATINTPGQSGPPTDETTTQSNDGQKSLGEYFRVKFRSQVRPVNTRLKKTDKTAAVQSSRVFGVPLRISIQYANSAISLPKENGGTYIYGYIPILVARTGVFLKEKATHVENVFAIGGSLRRLREMQRAFEKPDRYGKDLDLSGYTVYDAANLLLRYLLQLPEPVITWEFYDRFRCPLTEPKSTGTFDPETAILAYQRLINEMPPLHRQLLLYLLELLAVFAANSDDNKMTAPKLAAIFQPGLLSHPQHSFSLSEYQISREILVFLIENKGKFLSGVAGAVANDETDQGGDWNVYGPR